MINKLPVIVYKKLKRITPSQYYALKNCEYKAILGEAFLNKPLLPISPDAHLGTVLHKMYETITKDEVIDNDDLERKFNVAIDKVEMDLKERGLQYFLPLKYNIKDFGLKKYLFKKAFSEKKANGVHDVSTHYYSEKWFESKDKCIGGKIDLIIEKGEKTEIIDFKTGAVYQEHLDDFGESFMDLKEEYKVQLKLYAELYYENSGRFPTQLSISDLFKQKHDIEFTEDDCLSIYYDAKSALTEINHNIEKKKFRACTSFRNCSFCLYRPACKFYSIDTNKASNTNDIRGKIISTKKYPNGNINVDLESDGTYITISGFPDIYYDSFQNSNNKVICIYNLRKTSTPQIYSYNKTTIIYEQDK